ncbi:hypothetical protein FSP39_016734 [Pinctada imbricata]|uniref:Bleomycin hydrolase n=1 Tax=Pinctada imbricata TaxID=66713 RepID=A0AA88XWW7_PINIB|nr:hypothetical protein FSP39_016734 [Pinctada imbricata]
MLISSRRNIVLRVNNSKRQSLRRHTFTVENPRRLFIFRPISNLNNGQPNQWYFLLRLKEYYQIDIFLEDAIVIFQRKPGKHGALELVNRTVKLEDSDHGIPFALLGKYEENFSQEDKNKLAQNVCIKQDLSDVLKRPDVMRKRPHVFNCKVPGEGKPMTNQKASGRCWIFACLNVMRQSFMKAFKVDDFEFSQNHLFFWDKMERANYNLDSYIQCARQGETAGSRLVHHLLINPAEDGGQWDMLINVIEKHGVMPKSCFTEAQSAESSRRMCGLINNKMREFCQKLQKLVTDKATDQDIQKAKEGMLEQIYKILSICLGTPPREFTWEYYNNEKVYNKIGPIKPKDFYDKHVKPLYNVADKVCIVNDPRPQNPYGALYTVDYLGNMSGGKPVLYVNQPIDVLKQLTIESIKAGEAVWFGCDVGKCFSLKPSGILDLQVLDFNLVFGLSVLELSKSDRLMYGESLMTHAMVLTGVNVEDDKSTKWRVENSWGDSDGDKGYLVMSDDWFSEFVYEVVIDKKFIPDNVLNVLQQKPKVLPAWDPMGALAKL